jgi:Phage integrase family
LVPCCGRLPSEFDLEVLGAFDQPVPVIPDDGLRRLLAACAGKGFEGRRERALPFGQEASAALDRYLRVRARHKDAALPWLWLGLQGRLTRWGLVQMLRRRGEQAGLPGLHPHQLRHAFAHQWLAEGGGETDLMRLAGWKSRAMLQRCGASAADARAREAHPPSPLPRRPPVARLLRGSATSPWLIEWSGVAAVQGDGPTARVAMAQVPSSRAATWGL